MALKSIQMKPDHRVSKNVWSVHCQVGVAALLAGLVALGCQRQSPAPASAPAAVGAADQAMPPLPKAPLKNLPDPDRLPSLNFGGDQQAPSAVPPSIASTDPKSSGDGNPENSGRKDDDGFQPARKLGPLELVLVDPEKLTAAGLQITQSKHLRLIHEPAMAQKLSEFCEVFDQATDQWVGYFGAAPGRFESWQVTCFYVIDEDRFAKAGLMPPSSALPGGKLPPGGWEFGNQIWLVDHPGQYYSRHQLLHEGTHAFCYFNFGRLGPPWLAEGLAEYLALHRWQDGKLQLAARIVDKEEIQYWGRVKLLQDAWSEGQPKSLAEVMGFLPSAFPATESYAYAWAAVSLLSESPATGDIFLQSVAELSSTAPAEWNRQLLDRLPWSKVQREAQWQTVVSEMEYGYDFERNTIHWSSAAAMTESEFTIDLPADGAWHETDYLLGPGNWSFHCEGTAVIAEEEGESIVTGPDGISIQYSHGFRIGLIQLAVQDSSGFFQTSSPLTRPIAIGKDSKVLIQQPGRLYLRVNDDPSFLNDNNGQFRVHVQQDQP